MLTDDEIFELDKNLQTRIADNVPHAEIIDYFEASCGAGRALQFEVLKKSEKFKFFDVVDTVMLGLVERYPDDKHLYHSVAISYNSVDRFERGISIAKFFIESNYDTETMYSRLAYGYKYAGEREKVLNTLKVGFEKFERPVFYQACAVHNLPNNVIEEISKEVMQGNQKTLPDPLEDISARSSGALCIETLNAQEIGTDCAVLSGVLTHTAAGGEYCFQYGNSADVLDKKTAWHPTPPGLFSEVRDTTLSTFSSWLCYGSAHEFPVDPCAIVSKWPFACDRNHIDGIGQITLLYGWSPSALSAGEPTTISRMHAIDLRGGKVSFQVRHRDMDAKGGSLVFGIGSHLIGGRIDDDGSKTWAASQWMMTGKPQVCENTKDEEWGKITFDVQADPQLWSYGASNREEQHHYARYTYLPLGHMTERHNSNLVVCQMFADECEIPEGEITLREGRAVYRDWSMLRNGNGAELVVFPGHDHDAALKLTNGQYRNQADGWHRTKDDAASPCKFIWKLPEGGQPDGIVLVQHPRYPVLFAQVYLREGGPDGRIVYAGMPNLPEIGFDQPKRFFIEIPKDSSATHLEVNLMQGQNAEGIGLMGVEVFGDFTPKHGANDSVTVCEDVAHLTPGADLHYQLVYRDGSDVTEGKIHTLKLPGDATPILHTLEQIEYDERAWLLHGNPMGLDTKLEVRLDGDVIKKLPFGRETYRRHMVVRVTQDQYVPGKVLEVVAKNEHGASAPISLTLS